MQEELARLSNYVESALTIARAEQGRLELHAERIQLKEFLIDVIEPFTFLAATAGRKLLCSCPIEVQIWSDRNALKQILFNVLNNALQHGAGNIFLRCRVRAGEVVILIGNGLPAKAELPGQGLGIGLKLVRALIQQMPKARMKFRRGSFFCVQLRLPVTQTQTSDGAIPSTGSDDINLKMLVPRSSPSEAPMK